MGKIQADEFAALAPTIGLEQAIEAHLSSNHFPAIPHAWAVPAVDAVLAVADGLPGDKIDVTFAAELTKFRPRGWMAYAGRIVVDAEMLVEVMHLQPFVDAITPPTTHEE